MISNPGTILLFVILQSAITMNGSAQSVPDSVIKKIDKIFARWDKSSSPGCAVGVIRNDSLIFAKGYGMANLEYNIPIEPTTIFHMASISKQFTAFAIVLLARQGKLQLDDDIHKYLPWFPDLKEKITIRNLLNHTSGIRDQWQLLAISGTRLDDVITQDQIIKILSKQAALNFKPGEQYMYSNSGFTMLGEIVRSVTSRSLREFTDSAIFKPLGMKSTTFHDDYQEIVKNRSYSYERKDSGFTNDILSYSNAGATSLFTNIVDMSKWIMNFYMHRVGDQKDIDQLTQKTKLNDGTQSNYALGIVSDTYKGRKQFLHGGADAGYRTFLTVLPDLRMGFAVFSNLGDVNTGDLTYQVAGLFVSDTTKSKALETPGITDSTRAVINDTAAWKQYMGSYIGDDGFQVSFRLKNKMIYADASGQSFLLAKAKKDTLSLLTDPSVKVLFGVSKAGDTTAYLSISATEKHFLKKYVSNTSPSDQFLQPYTGSYYCPELDCTYRVVLKDHRLVLTNNKYDDTPLTLIGTEHLLSDFWWMRHMMITRDNKRKITGFEVTSGRVMHLKFEKAR